MSKKYLLEMLIMSDDTLNRTLGSIPIDEFRDIVRLGLKEQDRDTRHACAEATIGSNDPHNACMNCNLGLVLK